MVAVREHGYACFDRSTLVPKTVKSQNKATSRQHIVIFSPASLQRLPAPCWGTEKDDNSNKNVGEVPQLRVWNRQQS